MSATVKLRSALPGDPGTNGLDAKVERLLEDPEKLLVCLAWVDVHEITEDVATGSRVPKVQVRRIEPLGDVDEVDPEIRQLVSDLVAARTGQTPLPFETAEADDPGEV